MQYDLCVIGAGWAGFNAALYASRLGKKVCLIEDRQVGGTCLNRGCIPTKAWVAYSQENLPFAEFKNKTGQVIERLRKGIEQSLGSQHVDYVVGKARIEKHNSVRINENTSFKSKFILIATGSVPCDLASLRFDHERINSTDDVLEWKELPKSLLIIGGGVIGCEFAGIFRRLGVDVTVFEIMPQLLPGLDPHISKKLHQAFQKTGISVELEKKCEEVDRIPFDKILLAVGRKPLTEGLWEECIGIKREKEAIVVDKKLRTSVSNIFAAGDCIGGSMLAHVASYEGELAVSNMFLRPQNKDYSVVPVSIFTSPGIGAVGMSEEDARRSGIKYRVSTVSFLSIGMAHILDKTQGFAKVIVEAKSGRILGAAIIGLEATELVNVFSIIIKNKITVKDLKKTIFAHPSVSEIIAQVS